MPTFGQKGNRGEHDLIGQGIVFEHKLREDSGAIPLSLYGVSDEHVRAIALMSFEHHCSAISRLAVGEGLDRHSVAESLRLIADAIEFQDCAEDMSPITP